MSLDWVTIGTDNGLSPVRHQAIIWTSTDPLHRRSALVLVEVSQHALFCVFEVHICSIYICSYCFALNFWCKMFPMCNCALNKTNLSDAWLIVIWTIKSQVQWNLNENTKAFIPENAFGNVACEMTAILSRGRSVNTQSVAIGREISLAREHLKGHYDNVIMSAMASPITGVCIIYSTVCLGAEKKKIKDQRKHQSSASLAFVRGIHW